MPANVVKLTHALEPFLFHCPLTGLPVCGDVEQAFEGEISPFLLFAITPTGDVFARSDQLPAPHGPALEQGLGALLDEVHRMDTGLDTEFAGVFLPETMAPLLNDSAVLFEVESAPGSDRNCETFWVGMDFRLPPARAQVEHVAALICPE